MHNNYGHVCTLCAQHNIYNVLGNMCNLVSLERSPSGCCTQGLFIDSSIRHWFICCVEHGCLQGLLFSVGKLYFTQQDVTFNKGVKYSYNDNKLKFYNKELHTVISKYKL